jgi:hypothetical protein
MNGTENITTDSELILRRLLSDPPEWGLFLVGGFVLVVLFLVLFFRQDETVGAMLKRAHIPHLLVGILGLLWTAGLVLYVGGLLTLTFMRQELDSYLVTLGALPLIAFPLLLGLFIAVMLLVQRPAWLFLVGGVALACAAYVVAGHLFLPVFGWWVVLVPVLAIALFYVGLMYVCDAHTINGFWAAFLGLLRCTVYCTLAAVFLLPGCQTYQTTETHSKVLVLFDVSGSMNTVDDRPVAGQDPKTLLSRQGYIVKFLTDPQAPGALTFMDRVQAKSPATLYRFGGVLDDVDVEQFLGNRKWDREQWLTWLTPDRNKIDVPREFRGKRLSDAEQLKLRLKLQALREDLLTGTNVSGSALQAAVAESGHLLQAIILVSDGRSNLGSGETFKELLARAANPKRPIHIFTVGVGEYRPPVGIRVADIKAPQQARPDDKFPVIVPVYGDGLNEKPFNVTLEAQRVTKNGDKWEPIAGDKFTIPGEGKFAGGGEHPFDEVKFEIDIRKLRGIKEGDDSQDNLVEGTWELRARVPRDPAEAFPDAEHVSKQPARVVVQKRKLRVLLFASGPSRDYQFLRTLFYREVREKRMDLSIYLQTAGDKDVDQDVSSEKLLTRFPDRLAAGENKFKTPSLSDFDVIVAFDPDWDKLDPEQIKLLSKWVGGPSAGGLIFVAGLVNTHQMVSLQRQAEAQKEDKENPPLPTILPVIFKDSRLHSIGIGHDASRPYALNFPDRAKQYDFLKLEEGKDFQEGWDMFFWGGGPKPEPGKDIPPKHGFFNYYPVEKLRPAADVLATFAGPTGSRINDGKDEQPYLVWMKFGQGRTVYIGSPELWRLRQFKTTYHERFWVKLARFAGSGALGKLSEYGKFVMGSREAVGLVKVEAQVLGLDQQPMRRDARPVVQVVRPDSFDPKADPDSPESFELKAKSTQGPWNGYFAGTFKVRTPGDYTLKIAIPGAGQSLTHDLTIYRPDPETDITRPDHGHLYQLATIAKPVLNLLDKEKRKEVLSVLRAPADLEKNKEEGPEAKKDEVRLYFPLKSAHLIPDCLRKVEPIRDSTKGRLQDLWDLGEESGLALRADHFIMLAVAAIGLLGFAILMFIRRWVFAAAFLGGALVVVAIVALVNVTAAPSWADLPLDLSYVLALVVGLLAIEWLTRKLLKLA